MRLYIVILALSMTSLWAESVIKNYKTGELKSKTEVKNTLREGLSQGYYKDGSLKYETYFKADKRDKISKSYYSDGTLKAEQSYTDGLLNGISKKYYKSGKLKSKFDFVDDIPISGTSYTKEGKEVE